MQRTRTVIYSLVAILCAGTANCSATQWESPLAHLVNLMPADTIAFVGTNGGDELGPAFKESYLGQAYYDDEVQYFLTSLKDALVAAAEEEDVPEGMFARLEQAATVLLGRPFVLGLRFRDNAPDLEPTIFLLLQGGAKRGEVDEVLTSLLDFIREQEESFTTKSIDVDGVTMTTVDDKAYWGWNGDIFMLAVNDDPTRSVAAAVAYARENVKGRCHLWSHVQKLPNHGDLLVSYADLPAVGRAVAPAMQAEDPNAAAQVVAVLDALGLLGIGHDVVRIGFDDNQLVYEEFAQMPAPRKGLAAAFEPIDPALLAMVGPDLLSANLINVNAGVLYDSIMAAIHAAVGPEETAKVNGIIADFEAEAGIKIREGLIDSLAGPVVTTTHIPQPPGMISIPGMVVMARLSDADKMNRTLTTLETYLREAIGPNVNVMTQQLQGREVHVWSAGPLAMVQLMPTWSIVDDWFVLAWNMQLFNQALARYDRAVAADASETLAQVFPLTEPFREHPNAVVWAGYTNTPLQVRNALASGQQIWGMLASLAMQHESIQLPLVLPMLTDLVDRLPVGVGHAWFTDDGVHGRMRTPLPAPTYAAAGALGTSIALPALGRARELAKRVQCAAQLSGTGRAIALYQNDHEDHNPPNLEALYEYDLVPKMFQCPSDPQAEERFSYIYRGADLGAASSPELILAHDRPGNHHYDAWNILYAGFNVKRIESDEEFQAAIDRDNKLRREFGLKEIPAEGPDAASP